MSPTPFSDRRSRVRFGTLRLTRMGWMAAILLVTTVASAMSCRAEDGVSHRSVQLRVGETRRLGTFGGHRMDCITSVPPNTIRVVQEPRLGILSERQGVPYIAKNSISGTCAGAKLLGTAVDYTARAPGSDAVALDPVFNNGVAHWVYTVTVVP